MSSDGRTVVELIRITDPGTGRDMERLRIKPELAHISAQVNQHL
jgi:hypothetical protein